MNLKPINNSYFHIRKSSNIIHSTFNMFASHHQSTLLKMLDKYFQPKSYTDNPLNEQLLWILKWVKHYRNDQIDEVQKIITYFQARVKSLGTSKGKKDKDKEIVSNPEWLTIVKSLMLVHYLLSTGLNGSLFEDLLENINDSLHNLQSQNLTLIQKEQVKSQGKQTNTLSKLIFNQQTIFQKLLLPYHHYLTRRCQMLPKTFTQQAKCHYLINLMNSACKCNQVIYIFARYKHFDEFSIMGQFNTIMAKDIKLLYDLLKGYLRQGVQIWTERKEEIYMGSQSSDQILLQGIVTVEDIDDLLLSLHEKLFHIFYNKYYYMNVLQHVPKWIDLDANYSAMNNSKLNQSCLKINNSKSLNQQSNSKSMRKSMVLQETMVSLSWSGKQTRDEERIEKSLELIGDMERFLQNFDHVVV